MKPRSKPSSASWKLRSRQTCRPLLPGLFPPVRFPQQGPPRRRSSASATRSGETWSPSGRVDATRSGSSTIASASPRARCRPGSRLPASSRALGPRPSRRCGATQGSRSSVLSLRRGAKSNRVSYTRRDRGPQRGRGRPQLVDLFLRQRADERLVHLVGVSSSGSKAEQCVALVAQDLPGVRGICRRPRRPCLTEANRRLFARSR